MAIANGRFLNLDLVMTSRIALGAGQGAPWTQFQHTLDEGGT